MWFLVGAGLVAFGGVYFMTGGQLAALQPGHRFSLLINALLGMATIWLIVQRRQHRERLGREIASRKRVESELLLGREEFRLLADKCPTGIFRTDASGACTYVNECWCRLSGRTAGDATGGGWGNAIHPDDLPHVLEVWHDALPHRRVYTVEYRVQRPDGTIRHAITIGQPVYDEGGGFAHYIGIVLDITDMKQAYIALEQKERVLRNLIDAQESEKQMIGHDIHDGVLQYVIGGRMLLESLLRDHPAGPGLDVINAVLRYLNKGIEEGRQVVRGVRPPVLDDLGLGAALEDLAAHFAGLGVSVECRIDADLASISPPMQTAIYRIAQESLSNARKHSGSDRAMLSLRRCDDGVRLEIEDHGRGFEVESVGQCGFGLLGMTERVRLVGGELRVESSPSGGTRICVKLPLAADGDEPLAEAVSEPASIGSG